MAQLERSEIKKCFKFGIKIPETQNQKRKQGIWLFKKQIDKRQMHFIAQKKKSFILFFYVK